MSCLMGRLVLVTGCTSAAWYCTAHPNLLPLDRLRCLQVMLVRVGVHAVLHDCVTIARELSPQGTMVDKDELACTLALPGEEELHAMTLSGTLRTNTTRPATAYSKQLAQVRRIFI